MDISELQKRRAVNLIWNGARDHGFTPDFKAYSPEGTAELYWNTVIGAVRLHYEYDKLEEVFRSFQEQENPEDFEGLLWLGLENAVYQREAADRPVLTSLRREYAERYCASIRQSENLALFDALTYGHYRRILGQDDGLDTVGKKLLDELEFSADLSTDQITDKAKQLFIHWFHLREKNRKQKPFFFPGLVKRDYQKGKVVKFGLGFADHPDNIYGKSSGTSLQEERHSRLSVQELRKFMEGKYGKSLLPPAEVKELERKLCTGNHRDCHLHLTAGEKGSDAIHNGFEALQREKEAKQIQKNRDFYAENIAANRTAIQRLTHKIQNSALMYLQPMDIPSRAGKLESARAWRAEKLNDGRIFTRTEQNNAGNLSVDILLDASTSQKNRQEIISSQAYIIAASLTNCAIPCRVMSFCSMTGFTIARIFRDYYETGHNDRVFEYVSNGCNRDGFALRIARELMARQSFDNKILIILSDAKPNDVVKLGEQGQEKVPYEGQAGITDTAQEVRRAIAEGISVICVFTGEDEDIPAAKLIYDRDFARIQSVSMLADTVGKLLQNKLRNL